MYNECYSLFVRIGPESRSPHPVLTLVLRIFICVHTVLSNAKAPYGATTVYVSATGSHIALAQKNQTDGPSARLTH